MATKRTKAVATKVTKHTKPKTYLRDRRVLRGLIFVFFVAMVFVAFVWFVV